MKLIRTIRGQLTIYFVLVFGIMLCIFSIILYNIFANQNRNDLDKSMQLLAANINDEMQNDSIQPEILDEARETFIPFSAPNQKFIEIRNESDKIILRSAPYDNEELPIEKESLEKALKGKLIFETSHKRSEDKEWKSGEMRILLYPVSFRSQNYLIVIGIPVSNLEDTLFKFRLLLYIAVPLTLLLSALTGWIFSKKAYAPINEIIENANLITASNLDSRLPVNNSGDEISRLAATLNDMMERLQRSFISLKQFTSDASHELRTPLTILKGEIEVALNTERSVSEYERILNDNLEEVERLQKIVDGLLTLSQMESGKIPAFIERIDLNELLIEAVSKINSIAKKKNIRVVIKLNENEISDSKRFYIKGDHSKLLNVFLNLLDNAVKYSGSDSEIICSEVLIPSENKILISIKDNGRGIPSENLENIFNRFYRSDLSRTRDGINGAGLGLAIAKAVIEAHQGKISATSSVGSGSIFTITFPLTSD